MAETRLIAYGSAGIGGPSMPFTIHASLGESPWPGGGVTNDLILSVGWDVVCIGMVDSDQIAALAERLGKLAAELRDKETRE